MMFHWLFTPFYTAMFTKGVFGSACFTAFQVFVIWTFYGLALELDNPFGTDVNDLHVGDCQRQFNCRLSELLHNCHDPTPRMSDSACVDTADMVRCFSLNTRASPNVSESRLLGSPSANKSKASGFDEVDPNVSLHNSTSGPRTRVSGFDDVDRGVNFQKSTRGDSDCTMTEIHSSCAQITGLALSSAASSNSTQLVVPLDPSCGWESSKEEWPPQPSFQERNRPLVLSVTSRPATHNSLVCTPRTFLQVTSPVEALTPRTPTAVL